MPMHDLECDHPKPVFSRKHYEIVADSLHDARVALGFDSMEMSSSQRETRDAFFRVQEAFCARFLEDNHLFDEQKFRVRIVNGPYIPIEQRGKHAYR